MSFFWFQAAVQHNELLILVLNCDLFELEFPGMADVLPNDQMYIPRLGKNVLINIGQPIDVSEVLESVRHKTAVKRRKVVTDFVQDKLIVLREETLELREKLRKNNTLP